MDQTQDRLSLQSRLSDVPRLSIWIDGLVLRYAIPANIQFVMILCLEEAISNIICHGYSGTENGSIDIRFQMLHGHFEFIVDDGAPAFNPLLAPELPALNPNENMRLGGHGIRLLREFADEVEHEATPTGNRLRIRFLKTGPAGSL